MFPAVIGARWRHPLPSHGSHSATPRSSGRKPSAISFHYGTWNVDATFKQTVSRPLSQQRDTLISGCEYRSSCPAQLVGVWPSPNYPRQQHPGPVRYSRRQDLPSVSGNERESVQEVRWKFATRRTKIGAPGCHGPLRILLSILVGQSSTNIWLALPRRMSTRAIQLARQRHTEFAQTRGPAVLPCWFNCAAT